MARRATKQVKEPTLESKLWAAADVLRNAVEAAEYKHIVLNLFFLRFASEKFEEQRRKLIADGKEKYVEIKEFYTKDNVFFVPEDARWSKIKANAKQSDIAIRIDKALELLEAENPELVGALPSGYFVRLELETSKLGSLVDEIGNIVLPDDEQDIIGRVYEYYLTQFALKEGKGKGEFYTPKTVVKLIVEMIEPFSGKVYDPCCGSGGMFVQSVDFVSHHQGTSRDISIYGQEYTATTYRLAKMNLAIRGISANLGAAPRNTFSADQHKDLKADFILANPPFNQKKWRAENELVDDPRWDGYEVPPTSNANYGWILHIASKLSQDGIAGFLLANGALSESGTEQLIRKQLIENDLVEAIAVLPRNLFYTTDISVTLWILNRNKKARFYRTPGGEMRRLRDRTGQVLFLDLRRKGVPFEKKYVELSDEERAGIAGTYHAWQSPNWETEYEDVPEYCYSATKDEIASKDYTLVPSRYIEFTSQDEAVDYDERMRELQCELADALKQEEETRAQVLRVFEELGYGIEL